MSGLPALVETGGAVVETTAVDLYKSFLAGRSRNTREAYAADMEIFAQFMGETEARDALSRLISFSYGEANGLLLGFRASMIDQKLSPNTINRRLSAVKSAVKLARTLGLTAWVPEVGGVKSRSYRDTAGPGVDGTRSMLQAARAKQTAAAFRDEAIIRLFFDLALRRGEVVALDVDDIDVANRRIWFLGKGRTQKEYKTLPERTLKALEDWMAARIHIVTDSQPALFVALNPFARGRRITGRGVHYVIAALGEDAGLKTRPHGLRHASITAALDRNNGDVRAAQQHARHAKPETTMKYDDNRKDLAGRIANDLSTVL